MAFQEIPRGGCHWILVVVIGEQMVCIHHKHDTFGLQLFYLARLFGSFHLVLQLKLNYGNPMATLPLVVVKTTGIGWWAKGVNQ